MSKPTEYLTSTVMDAAITQPKQLTQPFDLQAIYQKYLDHLIKLAKQKGWKEEAWRFAQELDTDQSGIWTGIKDDLLKAMQHEKKGKT